MFKILLQTLLNSTQPVPVFRLFSGSGPEETTWSELRHELLGPGERAAGWRPELQLASRMRASFQVIIIITFHQYQTLSLFVFHSVLRQTLATSTAQFYLMSPLRSHLER